MGVWLWFLRKWLHLLIAGLQTSYRQQRRNEHQKEMMSNVTLLTTGKYLTTLLTDTFISQWHIIARIKGQAHEQSTRGYPWKIGYGMGDAGCNIVGGAVFLFLNYYYTDVYGLTAATVAAIWLGVRVIEAVSDPLIGMLADRTRTRWGSSVRIFSFCFSLCHFVRINVYSAGFQLYR